MAVPIRMPDLGTTVDEFRVMRWLVAEGESVALGDALAEVETDKAIVELEATASGVLLRQCVQADEMARTGDILAYVGEAGELIPETSAAETTTQVEPTHAAPVVAPGEKTARVAPLVRNLAAKMGLDLSSVVGTGHGGAITREDVQRTARHTNMDAPEVTALSHQAAVARAVAQSWTQIPHTYFTAALDMTAAQAIRAASQAAGTPISFNALLLRAMALALQQFPSAGACWQDGQIVPRHGIHLALAVDIEEALYLPVLRDADHGTLDQLQAAITEAVTQVQEHALPAERMTGGVMALSNLGSYPLVSFDPLIYPGHSAMLSVGAIHPTAVVLEERILVRPLLNATLAVDHRLINGRLAAAFLTHIKNSLESGAIR